MSSPENPARFTLSADRGRRDPGHEGGARIQDPARRLESMVEGPAR
jgi:hypothetical protein